MQLPDFEKISADILNEFQETFVPMEKVDAYEFITSEDFLGEEPTPFQSLAIKVFYGLFPKYGVDASEQELIDVMRDKWRIEIDPTSTEKPESFVLCLGRRATKSTLMSFFATYSCYELICLGNPQEHYGIRTRHPIFITHVAAAGDQAEAVFTLTNDNIRKVDFFRPYIDFEKDSSTNIRLFTPYDLLLNERIRARNKYVPRGYKKESMQIGSVNVKSITTSATTKRGDATYLLMLSEFAHFVRAKIDPDKSEEQLMEENPRSDYAVKKGLTPSVKDFGKDGRVIYESSPAEKGGEFYRQYCIAGGREQEDFENVFREPGYKLLQLATWEARPSISRESLEPEFRTDPVGANSEYGAHFRNVSGSFISEAVIESIPQPGRPILWKNPSTMRFIIAIDPGGKAKKKKADTYAVAWGHSEGLPTNPLGVTYWIDGMRGFDVQVRPLGNGRYERILVNPNDVVDFVVDLINKLGGRNYIMEIAYDQFDSSGPIATLQGIGLPAIETTFTNPYKSEMYGNFLAKAQNGQVKMYGLDNEGWVDRWKLEMKYLQQNTAGAIVYYTHPSTGPVQTDDFADVTANLVHRLCLRVTPTKKSVKEAQKAGVGLVQKKRVTRPVRGTAIWSRVGGGIGERIKH